MKWGQNENANHRIFYEEEWRESAVTRRTDEENPARLHE
jgi:hypothetical protein